MQYQVFSPQEYVSYDLLNTATAELISGISESSLISLSPGLIHPETASVSGSAFSYSVALPKPFGVLFGSGNVAYAHGTQNGADSQTYSFSFSSLVPATGMITAYVLVSSALIYQNAYTVSGPPPSNNAYSPAFSPFSAYSTAQQSLALTASTTPPDNQTTFALFTASLVAGATGTTLVTSGQVLASFHLNQAPAPITTATNLSDGQQGSYSIQASNIAIILPDARNSAGGIFTFSVSSGISNVSIQSPPSTSQILGVFSASGTPLNSVTLNGGDSLTVWKNNSFWNILGGTIAALSQTSFPYPAGLASYGAPGTYSFTVPANVNYLETQVWAGGGGGGGAQGAFSAGSGGGGGGFGTALFTVIPGQVWTIVVGSGGTGGSSAGSNGVAGNNTAVYLASNPAIGIYASGGGYGYGGVNSLQTSNVGPGGGTAAHGALGSDNSPGNPGGFGMGFSSTITGQGLGGSAFGSSIPSMGISNGTANPGLAGTYPAGGANGGNNGGIGGTGGNGKAIIKWHY